MTIREPDFAGSWYPESSKECLRMFEDFEQLDYQRKGTSPLHGGIVPHAGWVFSGQLAYHVIKTIAMSQKQIETVILFGGHLGSTSPLSVMTHGEFWTPFGTLPTDEPLAKAVVDRFKAHLDPPEQHLTDNTIELQAPLIKHFLPQTKLLVIHAPPRDETLELAAFLAAETSRLGRSAIALGSTDLTHYGPNYGWAPRGIGPEAEEWVRNTNDKSWIDIACKMDSRACIDEALKHSNACCPGAAAAAIRFSREKGATEGDLLAYSTSSEVHKSASFVGYAAIVF